MDLRPSIDVAMTALGLDATVTLPDADPVPAVVFWLPPRTLEAPPGSDQRRAESQRVLVVRRSEVPQVPRGTLISAPETEGAEAEDWKVDGIERVDVDHYRCLVVPWVVSA